MAIYKFIKPAELNGDQLAIEINASNLYIIEDTLVIESDLTEKQVTDLVKAHKPTPKPEPTVAEKLLQVGLSVDDLKKALGL